MAPDDEGCSLRNAGVELVAVGTELVLGATAESNGTWLCQRLAQDGIVVVRRTIVGDDESAIRSAVADALARTGTVVCTGGLGPTQDDLTRPVVAALYGWPLEVNEAWLSVIRDRFRARGRDMPATNRVQAEVPRGAVLLENALGTAPGLALDDAHRGLTVLLPGVPHEMRWLTETHVIELLRKRVGASRAPVLHRVLRTTGLPESEVAGRLADIVERLPPLTLAFLPVGIGIDLRLTSWGEQDAGVAERAFDAAERLIRSRLGDFVYGTADEDLAAIVGRTLQDRGWTIAVAESCTGGLVAKRLSDTAGASAWLLAGVVAYANEAKERLLGVDSDLLRTRGAVSEQVVSAMLDGVIERTGAACAISVTGVAGPDGGTPEKPVGTVWIGARTTVGRLIRRHQLPGTRVEVRARATQAALAQLLELINAPHA